MIESFIYSSLVISICYFILDCLSMKKSNKFYIALFLLCFISSMFCKSVLHGDIYTDTRKELSEMRAILETHQMLTETQRKNELRLIQQHKREGQRYVKLAQETIPLFPSTDDQDLLEVFFTTAIAATANGCTWSTAVISIGLSCTKYGINVYREFKKLNHYLKCAQHEFEMMEFHQYVLEKG